MLALFAAAAPPIIKFIAKPGSHAAQHKPPAVAPDIHEGVANGAAPRCALCEAAAKEVPADNLPGQVAFSTARDIPEALATGPVRIQPVGYTIEQARMEPMRESVPHRENHDASAYDNASTERLIQPPSLAPNSAVAEVRVDKPTEARKSWRQSWRQVFGVGVAV